MKKANLKLEKRGQKSRVKIGVVSDTHLTKIDPSNSNQQKFFQKAEELFSDVSLILHAGDIGSFEVINFLEKFAPVKAVFGNMDDLILRRTFPEKLILELEEARIGLTHGSGAPWQITDRVFQAFNNEDLDCLVFGHTHEPFNQVVSDVLLFNPGSPTDTVYTSQNSLGLLYLGGKKIKGEIILL